jgi:L-lysine 2,3-aminomutase
MVSSELLTLTPSNHTKDDWQVALANVVTSVDELLSLLSIDKTVTELVDNPAFKLKVPREFIQKMEVGNPSDPLLLQVLARSDETSNVDGFSKDPLDEKAALRLPGLMHKYYGRVLLTLTGSCAINCRYCFRRHFPYGENAIGRHNWKNMLEYIENDDSIHEVIYSGGEPLLLKDTVIKKFSNKIATIPHVRTIRIHTRLPIVIPQRVTDSLIDALMSTGLNIIIVVHCNHPNEIDRSTKLALTKLSRAGIKLLNQSVLLRGVNDSVDILEKLSHCLFDATVLPYYLHQLDPVSGVAHFKAPSHFTDDFMDELRALLPGYLLPQFVEEIASKSSKIPIG